MNMWSKLGVHTSVPMVTSTTWVGAARAMLANASVRERETNLILIDKVRI